MALRRKREGICVGHNRGVWESLRPKLRVAGDNRWGRKLSVNVYQPLLDLEQCLVMQEHRRALTLRATAVRGKGFKVEQGAGLAQGKLRWLRRRYLEVHDEIAIRAADDLPQ